MEKPADFLDAATELAEAFTDAAILKVRMANAPESHPDFNGKNCLDCGDTLISARLALGKMRCVYCQDHLEKLKKRRN